jgi:hypothetical protein
VKEREIDAVHLAEFALRNPEQNRSRIAEASEKMAEAIKASEAIGKQQQAQHVANRKEFARLTRSIDGLKPLLSDEELLAYQSTLAPSTNSDDGNAAE